jgi:hypothetical protein
MASISTAKNTGKRRIKFIGADRKPGTIHLGTVRKKYAEEVKGNVESILKASLLNVSLDPETASWLAGSATALPRSITYRSRTPILRRR